METSAPRRLRLTYLNADAGKGPRKLTHVINSVAVFLFADTLPGSAVRLDRTIVRSSGIVRVYYALSKWSA